ncbi:MAG TPA: hypothetical protein DDX01_04455 [Holosporales bacterium]|nr:hypothetical protein [Holosporales bacterium]
MQMTIASPIGASPDQISTLSWDQIPWKQAEKTVQRLQMRIAKAIRLWSGVSNPTLLKA